MRKIDKAQILSTEYKKWVDNFEKQGKNHVKFRADYKYYFDLAMNLLYCQAGLCAYTEQQLCPQEFLKPEHWENGRFKEHILPQNKEGEAQKIFNGEIEHFDNNLKADKGWLWENLFLVESDTNNRKGTKEVDMRLKPDSPNYDPFQIFEYSAEHQYVVRVNIDWNILKEDVDNLQSIVDEVLGINFPNLVDKRRQKLTEKMKMMELGIPDTEPINEFPTAFEFCFTNLRV